MWGPISKRDAARHRRLDREANRRDAARELMKARLPFRKETLARVESGEITLVEAQKIIRTKEATDD